MFRKFIYWFSLLALLLIARGYGLLRTKLTLHSGEIVLPGDSTLLWQFDPWTHRLLYQNPLLVSPCNEVIRTDLKGGSLNFKKRLIKWEVVEVISP